MLKPGWADKIDPALIGLDDADQAQKQRGKRHYKNFRAPGTDRGKESASRGGKRGTATRVQRAALAKALPPQEGQKESK